MEEDLEKGRVLGVAHLFDDPPQVIHFGMGYRIGFIVAYGHQVDEIELEEEVQEQES